MVEGSIGMGCAVRSCEDAVLAKDVPLPTSSHYTHVICFIFSTSQQVIKSLWVPKSNKRFKKVKPVPKVKIVCSEK
jgi:hypothetical protein